MFDESLIYGYSFALSLVKITVGGMVILLAKKKKENIITLRLLREEKCIRSEI